MIAAVLPVIWMAVGAIAVLLALVVWQLFQRRVLVRSEEIEREVKVRLEKLQRENLELRAASKEASQLALERLQQKESTAIRERELADAKAQIEAQMAQLAEQQAQLELANAELKRSLDTIQLQQEQLIASEKLAVLGRLTAGITHEINSPVGAIKGIVQSLQANVPYLLTQLAYLTRTLPDEVLASWLEIRRSILEPSEFVSPREQRQVRRQLRELLEQKGLDFDDAETLSDQLSKAGLETHMVDVLMPILRHEKRDEIIRATEMMSKAVRGLQNIRQSVERTQRIVSALKHAVHERQETEAIRVPVDLENNLESVLSLYVDYTNQGLVVEKEFAPIGPVLGDPQALAQVWINLVLNAIQAMAGMKGADTLKLTIEQLDGQAVITIADMGPGIPQEIQKRVFDQFFTTKPKGEGTGLGLYISKKIIEEHGGTIQMTSHPGQTIFKITLPLASSSSEAVEV